MNKEKVYQDFSELLFSYRGCRALDLFKILEKGLDFDPFEPMIIENGRIKNKEE